MHRFWLGAIIAFVALGAQAQEVELKLGNTSAPGSAQALSADEYAKRVNERLKGKVKIVVFHNSQLGNENELLRRLKIGSVDFSQPSTIMSSVDPAFGVFDMPYLIKDRAHMAKVTDALFWKEFGPKAEAKGYKIIGVWENGFRHITNNVRPIDKPEDLKGVKLRVPPGVWRKKMFEAYGASPSPMQFSELFVALQTGVMDGQENPLTNIYSGKLHEVQKFLSFTNHVYTPSFLTVGLDKWNGLPAETRGEMERIAREMQPWVHQVLDQEDKDLAAKMEKVGIKINTANREAFVAASARIYEDFDKEVPGGKRLVEAILALAK